MKRDLIARGASWLVLAGSLGASGCTHNHYYGAIPAGLPVSSQVGQVCDVPEGQVVVSGTPVITPAPSSSVVTPGARRGTSVITNGQQRVVISQPAAGPSLGQSASRFKWRAPEPETLTTTRAEGYLDEETSRR